MRVLLDECVDHRLAGAIVGHQVQTVPRMGWAGKRNGEIMALAAADFDVFITVDRSLANNYDIARHDLAVVILVAASNRIVDLMPLIPRLLANLKTLKPGEALEIG